MSPAKARPDVRASAARAAKSVGESLGAKVTIHAEDLVPVRVKKKLPPTEVEVGELLKMEDGSLWRVTHKTKGSADVRCLRAGKISGNLVGRTLAVTLSRAGYKFATEDELEQAKAVDEVSRAQCDDCWAVHEVGAECKRDCACHDAPRRGARKAPPTPEEVARVLALRAGGMGYAAIEKELGWPDSHGTRPWKICKEAGK